MTAYLLYLKNFLKFAAIFLGFFVVFFFFSNLPAVIDLRSAPKTKEVVDLKKSPTQQKVKKVIENYPLKDNHLYIPSLGIKTPIVWNSKEKEILANLKDGVVLYPGSALPGNPGNIFIVGHSSGYWWDPGSYKTVFSRLVRLKKDQDIWVRYKNQIFIYKVSGTKVVRANDTSVLNAPKNQFILSLMTCYPVGTASRRLVVTASQYFPTPKSSAMGRMPKTNLLPKIR